MFLTIVNKRNSIIGLLNAIYCNTRLSADIAGLQDGDMVDSFPVPVEYWGGGQTYTFYR
jgi:hypothetical protein